MNYTEREHGGESHHKNRYRRSGHLFAPGLNPCIMVALALVTVALLCGCAKRKQAVPSASGGVIDLSAWDFSS
ncbi:MAG TPA: hypothetical protein PK307_06285 [Spirochaetota bacterium]|nr:hypothetical protein [Spirochaetota bacterium]HOD15398.1 hypothetical protein [Spirochaetota bacterium]HPG52532.1 hypothetical protein [Spirochaetota bacterium]HPN11244.1 hypothetical protein [Spirochaetota bacterium]HQL81788.1 hypothetical protein [Spirochaetota bacterium]